jgi:competence protein ComEA
MRSLILAVMLAFAGCSDAPPVDDPPPVTSLLDINTASLHQFQALPGIGPVLARKIIASRNARGGKFKQIDDLLAIDGIGPKKLDAIRQYIVLFP